MPIVAALSGLAIIALVVGALIGLAFVGGVIWLSLRGKEARLDVPPGMRPGPADETLERRMIVRHGGWSMLFVLFFATWLPIYWLAEPTTNVSEAVDFVDRSVERGGRWFAVATTENPTGFGCARCHGANAQGGTTSFTSPDGETIPDYAVPKLVDVCGGPNTGHPLIKSLDDVRDTIMEGRPDTPMPSWSIRFQGPMNDQQIQDLINYVISIQKNVPEGQNVCTNLKAAAAAATPSPEPTPTPSPGASPAATPSPEAT
jgi:mono/diheme cytochrome c family protein